MMNPELLAAQLDPLPTEIPGCAAGERPAAVLLAIRLANAGPEVLLIKRGGHLVEHAGQIALPGGRSDPGDPHPAATALREAEEEVGLKGSQVCLLGALSPISVPVSRHRVLPVVGWLSTTAQTTICSSETAALWFVPLEHLIQARRASTRPGRMRWEYPLPAGLSEDEQVVWGMTAMVLSDFLDRLQSTEWGKRQGR